MAWRQRNPPPQRPRPTKRMQATARMASVVSSTPPARRRLIRDVRPKKHMQSSIKNIAIAIAVALVGYLILFKTNMIISRMSSFGDWSARFAKIQSGNYQPDGAPMHIEYVEELRDDFLRYLFDVRSTLLIGAGGDAFMKAKSDRLVWRLDGVLYITNLSQTIGLPADYEPTKWATNITHYLYGRTNEIDDDELVYFAFVALNFDEVVFVDRPSGADTKLDVKSIRKASLKRKA